MIGYTTEVDELASRGQEASDLLMYYIRKACQMVAQQKFIAYIVCLKDEDDEGSVSNSST